MFGNWVGEKMKVCILSDSHDNISLLRAAVADAKQRGAEAVLHCGDIVAPSTLRTLQAYGLTVHAIHGNNTGDLYTLSRLSHALDSVIHYYGQDATFTLGGRRIFLVHYPHYARGMAITGDYDLVCCGHTHNVSIERLTNIKGTQTVVCNPGTVGGVGGAPATYLFGDLKTMAFETYPLPLWGKL
jgi:putative phosphoesterase